MEPTETPKAEKIQIKVGETQKTTVDGVKFTYSFGEKISYVKMENTTKYAKIVEGSVKNLALNGKLVTERMFEKVYLGAGQTFYGTVFDSYAQDQEIESLEVENMKVQDAGSKYEDCTNEIKVDSEKGKITGEDQCVDYEYTGDISKLDGKGISLNRSIVYYDSEGQIVLVSDKSWTVFSEDSTLSLDELQFDMYGIDSYEVFLSGAYVADSNASDDPNPEPTDKPVPTAGVKPTTKPTPTASVKPTETPDVEQTEVEVEDTKTATVDDVKFTYIAYDYELIVKMENTTEDSKSVSMTMDILDSDGDSLEVEDSVGNSGDCIEDISVTPAKGKDMERNEWTFEYKGELSKVEGKTVCVKGAVVYYNSDNKIIGTRGLSENVKFSSEHTTGTFDISNPMTEADYYEVVLCGGECYNW